MMGEDSNKMSKRLRNYKEPSAIFDTLGADAMRWYFFSAQAPWTTTRFTEANIRDSQREFLVKLYNVLSFFTIYASIDGFDPRRRDEPGNPMGYRPSAERTELDRWIITELHRTVAAVRESMDRFENFPAAQRLSDFVDALSNWYVRRSRDRFWRGEKDQTKWDAYHTLYGCLRTLSRLIAPFTPFFAETMHRHLSVPGDPESVHLCDYPKPEDIGFSDEALAGMMDTVRDLVTLGRSARAGAKLKVRQPLALVEVVLTDNSQRGELAAHSALIAEELNVKRVEFTTDADHYVSYKVVPNFKAIGAKFRALVPGVKAALAALGDPAAARKQLIDTGRLEMRVDGQAVDLTPDDVEIRLEAKPGWSAAQGRAGVVVVSTEVTPELRDEGVIRELIHHVQAQRKEMNLAYESRIRLHIAGPPELLAILRRFADVVKSECLTTQIAEGLTAGVAPLKVNIEGHAVELAIVAV
jgi:isoleucyl-tRNA synthetase